MKTVKVTLTKAEAALVSRALQNLADHCNKMIAENSRLAYPVSKEIVESWHRQAAEATVLKEKFT